METTFSLRRFLGGRLDLFSRGTFQQFTFLILFSISFTKMFSENILLYTLITLLITISNMGIESYSIVKKGPKPPEYIVFFMKISLPINIVILSLFFLFE
ncbi:hypothetical protein SAMN05421839_1146 [Halolactibacillus halophilus]|uniref:Uncharacterized protein n=1 Tax=Halolactibacillus halophilus TaxID=306540 RepID=A0A1I5PDB7_9BACI|nr:hypothetical protein SAMN05421839_1146 [Halolactibacillus halophilus]